MTIMIELKLNHFCYNLFMKKILGYKENIDLLPILENIYDSIDEYSFLLLHCYAHIKNAEIYYEIDKDIYEHVIIYEGIEFLHSVKQYSFTFNSGAILAYKKGQVPIVKMIDFKDPNDDYNVFIKDLEKLNKPEFMIVGDKELKTLISY